jgi:hypothetical protein
MYLAINKSNPNNFHCFEWSVNDDLIICNNVENPDEWDIVWVDINKPTP